MRGQQPHFKSTLQKHTSKAHFKSPKELVCSRLNHHTRMPICTTHSVQAPSFCARHQAPPPTPTPAPPTRRVDFVKRLVGPQHAQHALVLCCQHELPHVSVREPHKLGAAHAALQQARGLRGKEGQGPGQEPLLSVVAEDRMGQNVAWRGVAWRGRQLGSKAQGWQEQWSQQQRPGLQLEERPAAPAPALAATGGHPCRGQSTRNPLVFFGSVPALLWTTHLDAL